MTNVAEVIIETRRALSPRREDASLHAAPRQPSADAAAERVIGADLARDLAAALEKRLDGIEVQIAAIRDLLGGSVGLRSPVARLECDAPLRVSCLGTFDLSVEGVPFDQWRSGKARSLFQFLISQRGKAISRDTLINALWPDTSVGAPGTSLKVAVHSLRQVFRRLKSPAPAPKIICQGLGYRLVAPELWLDVEEFEHFYAVGRIHEQDGRASEAMNAYIRAAELYRGDFLEEEPDDWPAFRREHLKDQYLFTLTRLATMAQQGGDFQGAIGWCHRLLAKDRCREDTYRTLMVCHAHLGQRSRVRRWYELCVQTLREELDCQPEPETERVFRRALEGKL